MYYTTDVYKDMNSPKLRPVYKHVTYFYKDEARTIELDGNPVVTIIDGT